jgi:hypothetical protein
VVNIIQEIIEMIEEKAISGSNLATIKNRIKFFEANDPNGVILRLLKQQISNQRIREDRG